MAALNRRKFRFLLLSFFKHDFRASLSVFFVALPLCLGISLASGAPLYSGLVAGIVGGIVVSIISGSELSVSGPAAGLTSICAAAIITLGSINIFFLSVMLAGLLQVIFGIARLGGFTHFIPSAVIKGMLTAIGIILISKQFPAMIGYDKPEFWSNELFNIISLNHVFSNVKSLYEHISAGAIIIAVFSFVILAILKKINWHNFSFIPSGFILVFFGSVLAYLFKEFIPSLALEPTQYVTIPPDFLSQLQYPDFKALFSSTVIWKTGVIIFFVASLETLLSIEAIDKLDPYNRITPQNRELIAQGAANLTSGFFGGLPITAVIVRSSANAEAGARTRLSAFFHGIWILVAVLFAVKWINFIPYTVLAVILIRTGYNLAKPRMVRAVYKQGREQFLPFIVTAVSILFTDLLIGVLIGIIYCVYFIVKHTYRAGYTIKETKEGHYNHYIIELALNVSFLNKKRFLEMLDKIPDYSIVEIIGTDSVYIDNDILEIFQDYKSKAHRKHIQLTLKDIPEVQTLELH